jgi:Xaa-Pro dipeptidase
VGERITVKAASSQPSVIQGSESAFPKAEYDSRMERARALLTKASLDAMIVTGPENIFYLTGQQTPGYYALQALVLASDGDPAFVVRQLEHPNFVANTFLSNVTVYRDGEQPVDVLAGLVRRRGLAGKRLAIDKRGWFLPVAVYEALRDKLGAVDDGAGLIEQLRAIKSPAEVAKIEQAAAYVDAGMRAGLATVQAGAGENDIAAAMMAAAIAAGSEYVGMEPLVSSGPRTGTPHATWRRRRLMPGEPAVLAMAACHDRYHAALMRGAWLGAPPPEADDMARACEEGLQAALDAIRPGARCEAPHLACQRVIDRAGFAENFRKRTGYSIGISFAPDWGEGGILSLYAGVTTELRPGMTFHLPPALRLYGRFGVGVSETVVVTEAGYRVLGTVPRPILRVAA